MVSGRPVSSENIGLSLRIGMAGSLCVNADPHVEPRDCRGNCPDYRESHEANKRLRPALGGEGTYHMTAGVQTSLYDLARMILEKADCISRRARWFAAPTDNRSLLTKPVVSIVTAERPAHARRPAHSVLSNFPLARVFGFYLPD